MAKWAEAASRAALDELLGDKLLTFAPDETGAMRFYLGNQFVGHVPASRHMALVQDLVKMMPR